MKIVEVSHRGPQLVAQLEAVWDNSVRKTHLFLSPAEISKIKNYVPQALRQVEHLIVAEEGAPVAFMGVEKGRLEMLFVAPQERGKGLGRRLVQYALAHYGLRELTVNEQNPQAVEFYEHLGFITYKRTDYDEQGNPYPLLYMKYIP